MGGDAESRRSATLQNDELARLADDTAELEIAAEEMFKNAAAALYDLDRAAIAAVIAADHQCAQMHEALHQRSLALLGLSGWGATQRRVLELQQTAAEFMRIARSSRQIAEYALALGGSGEVELRRIGGDAPALLLALVRQAYIEVRGCVVATTLHDKVMARRVAAEDAELDQLFLRFKALLNQAVAANPRNAATLQHLLLVGVYLEDIGNSVVAVCRVLIASQA